MDARTRTRASLGAGGLLLAGLLFLGWLALSETRAPGREQPPASLAPPARAEPGGAAEPVTLADAGDESWRAPSEPASPAPPTAPPPRRAKRAETGSVVGQVLDTSDRPVIGARVHLFGSALEARTDGAGRFTLADLRARSVQLEVLAEDLPPGLVPPRSGGIPVLTQVELARDGSPVEVTLRVALAASVTGRALGPAGEPCALCAVRARLVEPGRTFDGSTDEQGRFAFPSLWPGAYELEVWARPESTLAGLPRPRQRFDVRPGESLALPDTVFTKGSGSVRGRVIDQDGRALEGIAIVCGSIVGGTEADGSFRLDGLEPGSSTLWIAPSGFTGYRRIFAREDSWVSLPIDPAAPAEIDLGTLRIERDRLFEVHGLVVLEDPSTALEDLTLVITPLAADPAAPPAAPREIRPDPGTGAFTWWTAPEGLREVLFVVRQGDVERARASAWPAPDASIELRIPVR